MGTTIKSRCLSLEEASLGGRAANRRANRTGNDACQEIVFESSWRTIFTKLFLWRSFAH